MFTKVNILNYSSFFVIKLKLKIIIKFKNFIFFFIIKNKNILHKCLIHDIKRN